MKCIQTENSDVHSMYYGSLHFILFWGIAGNSPIFPVRKLSWSLSPNIEDFRGEELSVPKMVFPPHPEIPQNIFIKLSPSPPRPRNSGKGTGFPKFRGHGWPH